MIIVPLVQADDLSSTNKSQYTLLNPTPSELMRPWYTDNAGQSPYTIDAGHFEGDLTAFSYGHFHRSNPDFSQTTQAYSYADTEIKAGLLNNVDLEVAIEPYEKVSTTLTERVYVPTPPPIKMVPGTVVLQDTRSGFGDIESRIKWNLWGNDGGATAFAVGGIVYAPTGTGSINNEQFEGGVLTDFAAHLPCDLEMRIHNNVLSISDNFDNMPKRRFSFENEISLLHQLVGNLKGYCLFNTYAFTTPGRNWDGSIGVGLNYRIKPNVELFAGIDFGVQGTPFDYSPRIGVSARF